MHISQRYYDFVLYCNRGNDFLKPLIILDQSILRGADNLNKISEYVAKGDNIVILSNHQTEADPQVTMSCVNIKVDVENSLAVCSIQSTAILTYYVLKYTRLHLI